MREFIIIIFLLALAHIVNAQERGLSIGFGGSYDNSINEYRGTPWWTNEDEFSDIQEFSIGAVINYQFNERSGLRSDVSYSLKGYKLDYEWITNDFPDNSGDPSIPLETEFRLAYLDIPVGVYYKVIFTNRYDLAPSIGIMNSINIGESEISEMGDGSTEETEFYEFNTTAYLLGARLGLINNFNLSEKLFISLEPYITFNFSTINDTDIEQSQYTFGGFLSFNYKF